MTGYHNGSNTATPAAALAALRAEVASLAALNRELGEKIEAALAALKSPARPALFAPGLVVRNWLATVTNKDLRAALIAARGAQSVAVLVSKTNRDLVTLGKVRAVTASGRRNGNGNGAHVEL